MHRERKPSSSDSIDRSRDPEPAQAAGDPRATDAPFALRSIALGGVDAVDFAQAQFTLDVDTLNPRLWTPAAWCDAKGRTLTLMLLAIDDAGVQIAVPDRLADDVVRRLRMYQIGRNVTISDAGPIDSSHADGWPLSFDATRSLIPGTASTPPDWAAWLAEDIRHGIAWILPATAGRFLPQMLKLEELGGLSYRKGCWPGQEVVARVRYRGRVTRTVAAFRGPGDPPEPGATVAVEELEGTVLYAVADPEAPTEHTGLAVVPFAA
ncbi:CAF17-like 4Fe-4S cluster assembly/insertion protein YgfZ [Halomonas denitrificans]|nr:hypothetical protein [Halomonas denitrificans]